jgi:sulfate permease, SulP family
VVIVRVEAGLFFANADWIRARVLALARRGVRAIVVDAETVPYVDVTAAEMLDTLHDELARRGVTLYMARDIGQVRDVLRRTGSAAVAHVYATVPEAVAAATESR